MRVVDLAQIPRMAVTQYESRGFHWGWLTREGHAACSIARLEAGGHIGRHPAVGDQLVVVLSGHVECAGTDGHAERVEVGQAALFAHAEEHDTTATGEGALLLLVEGAFRTWPDAAQVPTARDWGDA